MSWIILSLIYGLFNALYMRFNARNKFNGYVLGIWRGFGIAALVAPFLSLLPSIHSLPFYLILISQGIMIGIYDSHIFFATSKYGTNTSLGFMSTTVLLTTFIWWSIDFSALTTLLQTPRRLVSLMILLCGFTISYWQMMRVHMNHEAERYLYPAVWALALMSIATKYIAVQGGKAYVGVTYYLVISCLVSGIYNLLFFIFTPSLISKKRLLLAPFKHNQGFGLIFFSIILITSKTLALRLADNPGYVMVFLMLTPLFSELINTHRLKIPRSGYPVLFFLLLFILWVT